MKKKLKRTRKYYNTRLIGNSSTILIFIPFVFESLSEKINMFVKVFGHAYARPFILESMVLSSSQP